MLADRGACSNFRRNRMRIGTRSRGRYDRMRRRSRARRKRACYGRCSDDRSGSQRGRGCATRKEDTARTLHLPLFGSGSLAVLGCRCQWGRRVSASGGSPHDDRCCRTRCDLVLVTFLTVTGSAALILEAWRGVRAVGRCVSDSTDSSYPSVRAGL